MWNSTDRWKRIVPNINKIDFILTSLNSLKKYYKYFTKSNKNHN